MKPNTWSAFRAVIWKEFRENWYWAVAFSIFIACGIAKNIDTQLASLNIDSPQKLWDSNWSIFSIAIPAFGLAIGLRQILSEKQGDRWAFLLHRPVSRDVIFVGKTVTTIVLMAVAMALPLVCAGIWLATPGNFPAPWNWRLLLPYCGLFVSAVGMYMTAVYAATRRSRWFGSRGLSVVGVISVVLLAASVPETWIAVVGSTVFSIVATLAASGSFRSDGIFARAGRMSQICQALVVSVVLVILVAFLFSVVLMAVDVTNHQTSIVSSPNLFLSEEGRVVICQSDESPQGDYCTELTGRKIKVNEPLTPNDAATQGWTRTKSVWRDFATRSYVSPISEAVADGQKGNLFAFYEQSENVLGLYSAKTRAFVGSITESGIQAFKIPLRSQPLQIFRVGGESIGILNAHTLTSVNVRTGIPSVIYDAAPGESLKSSSRIFNRKELSDSQELLEWIVVGSRGLVVKAMGRKPIHVAAYPTDEQVEKMSLYVTKKGNIVVTFWNFPGHYRAICDTYSPAGKFVSRETVPDFTAAARSTETDRNSFSIVSSLVPLDRLLFSYDDDTNLAGTLVRLSKDTDYRKAWLAALSGLLPLSAICSILCVVPAWLYARQAGLSNVAIVGWSIAMLPLGLLGLLLLISMIGLPLTETCFQCGKKRSIDQDQCRYCGAGWPVRTSDGTEIFEYVAAERLRIEDTVRD